MSLEVPTPLTCLMLLAPVASLVVLLFRYLRCPPGTAKAGELDVTHMNSWSHATNYPPIILSGMVDLIHTFWVPLPQGEQATIITRRWKLLLAMSFDTCTN